jgi:hypothetical protein
MESEMVRQFGFAANGYGGLLNIGQLILEESVRRSDSNQPLSYLSAVHLAEKFVSRESELRR